MDSLLANDAKKTLLITNQRLTPEARLNAFLEHCRLIMVLFQEGQRLKVRARQSGA